MLFLRKSSTLFVLAAVVSVFLSSPAFADDGAKRHDGFYLRFQMGPSVASIENSDETPASLGGDATAVGIQIGGAIFEDMILYGETFSYIVDAPVHKRGDIETQTGSKEHLDIDGVGFGFTYYLDSNFFYGASIRTNTMSVWANEKLVAEALEGGGAAIHFGKEWWVSANWGLGISVEAYGGNVLSPKDEWQVSSGAILFSSTFN